MTDRSTSYAEDRLRKQIFNEMTKRVLKNKESRKRTINKVAYIPASNNICIRIILLLK